MLRVEANGKALMPLDTVRQSLNDPAYMTAADGPVFFKLPANVAKLEIVFWNATLNDFTLSADVCR